MTVVYGIVVAMLGVASALASWRTARGPSTLDRAVALDTLTALAMCWMALGMSRLGGVVVLPILLAMSLLGFAGSTAIAKCVMRRRGDGGA
ncbi:monovalent cation/H+ antiporter complex subunit F [Nonomuraea sp. NPDC050310]|uniref:monovalent cation/H+ antiporter complex subunit F n=1 Tax=unclassified Nonomuraea TaxID=2593643 RepID=UPI0033D60919